MVVSLPVYLIVCPLMLVAGVVDAIAGGGGLITLPAYLIAGLPPLNAVATNKLNAAMGAAVSATRYALSGYTPFKPAAIGVVCATIGSTIGAKLALLINPDIFNKLMPILIVFTAIYIIFSPATKVEKEPFSEKKTLLIVGFCALIMGIYHGFYGPGMTAFLMILLLSAGHLKLTDANGVSKAINLASNCASLIVFLRSGHILVILGLVAGAFNMVGCYIGTILFKKKAGNIVRPVLLSVLALFLIKVIMENCGVSFPSLYH